MFFALGSVSLYCSFFVYCISLEYTDQVVASIESLLCPALEPHTNHSEYLQVNQLHRSACCTPETALRECCGFNGAPYDATSVACL